MEESVGRIRIDVDGKDLRTDPTVSLISGLTFKEGPFRIGLLERRKMPPCGYIHGMSTTESPLFGGSVPSTYDRCLGPVFFEPYARDLAARLITRPSQSVLEIAAGSGRLTQALIERLPSDARLVSTDISAEMLEVAKAKISDGRVHWDVADGMSLAYENDRFDAVLCQFGVMFYSEPVQGHREALRVLRPGGQLLFNVWGSHTENPGAEIVQRFMEEEFPEDPPQFLKKPYAYSDRTKVVAAVEEAGFTEVRAEWVDLVGESPTALDFAIGAVKGTPLIGQILARGGDEEAIVERAAVAFRKRFGDNPMRTPLRALVVQAEKPLA